MPRLAIVSTGRHWSGCASRWSRTEHIVRAVSKWHCAGDCYHKTLAVSGGAEFAGSDRCHITRELTKDQILERIAASGGLFWHEPRNDSAPTIALEKETSS